MPGKSSAPASAIRRARMDALEQALADRGGTGWLSGQIDTLGRDSHLLGAALDRAADDLAASGRADVTAIPGHGGGIKVTLRADQ